MKKKIVKAKTLTVSVPEYLAKALQDMAKECGVSLEEIAVYFFAQEVVHT